MVHPINGHKIKTYPLPAEWPTLHQEKEEATTKYIPCRYRSVYATILLETFHSASYNIP